ncbi:hypothetical protein D3C85_1884860 [compost metagenome]
MDHLDANRLERIVFKYSFNLWPIQEIAERRFLVSVDLVVPGGFGKRSEHSRRLRLQKSEFLLGEVEVAQRDV